MLPNKKYLYGIPTNGDPKFTNQLGINGVNLRNNIYHNKFYLWLLTILWNFKKSVGKYLNTKLFPKEKLNPKQHEAPRHEH